MAATDIDTDTENNRLMRLDRILPSRRSIQDSGALRTGIDRHTHILFGVDDGIQTLEESLKVLAYEESLGVTDIWCTPHIMMEVPNSTAFLRNRFEQLQHSYDGCIRLHLGAEYMMDEILVQRLTEGDILTIENDMILVEMSPAGMPYGLEDILSGIRASGLRPILAHPERYLFLKRTDFLRLKAMGTLFQLNIPSLTGWYGKAVRICAEHLLKEGMYSGYGSDCHSFKAIRHQYSEVKIAGEILRRVSLIDDNM